VSEEERLEIALGALKFYAEKSNWIKGNAEYCYFAPAFGYPTYPACDGFHVAIAALEKIEKENGDGGEVGG
jgi:hypothetical protein